MGIEPQVVYLVNRWATKKEIAIVGRHVRTRVPSRDVETFQTFQSDDEAAQAFARTLRSDAETGWQLDPERAVNPEPWPAGESLKPEPAETRLWRQLTESWKRKSKIAFSGLVLNPESLPEVNDEELDMLVTKLCATRERSLQIFGDGIFWNDAIMGNRLPTIERFILDTPWMTNTRQARQHHGDIGELLECMPNLNFVFVVGTFELSTLNHERLKSLHLLSDPLEPYIIDALREHCHLPNLETLALGFSSEHGPAEGSAEALAELVDSDALPRLRHVVVAGGPAPERVIEILAASGRLAGLESLELTDEADDEDAMLAVLRANIDALANVALRIRTEMLDEDELATIAARVPGLELIEQGHGFLPDVYL